ncbi:MAG: hypothetical protein ACRC2R_04955 [Xenococcaceae cyanobacterium]
MSSKEWLKLFTVNLVWQIVVSAIAYIPFAVQAQETQTPTNINISPEIIENSPVLQKWIEDIPNVAEEIRRDPSFRTRLKLGYAHFPSSNDVGGLNIGLEDVFLGRSGLTFSADYQTSFNGDRASAGGNLHYYVLPLGGYFNIAPVVGYRYLETDDYFTDGVNIGAKIILVLSRGGGADLSIAQNFISPGGNEEVGITSFSVGFALTSTLRLSTDLQKQNSKSAKDSLVGINFEWML